MSVIFHTLTDGRWLQVRLQWVKRDNTWPTLSDRHLYAASLLEDLFKAHYGNKTRPPWIQSMPCPLSLTWRNFTFALRRRRARVLPDEQLNTADDLLDTHFG